MPKNKCGLRSKRDSDGLEMEMDSQSLQEGPPLTTWLAVFLILPMPLTGKW